MKLDPGVLSVVLMKIERYGRLRGDGDEVLDPLAQVRAHIAALEKERDELANGERAHGDVLDEVARLTAQKPSEDTLSAVTRVVAERDAALGHHAAILMALAPVAEQARAVFEVHHAPSHCALGLNLKVHHGEALVGMLDREHPGAALLEIVNAIRQYQRADEPDVSMTLRRLLEERGRIAHMVPPDQHEKALVRARNEGLERVAGVAAEDAERARRAIAKLNLASDAGQRGIVLLSERRDLMDALAARIRAMTEPES